MERNETKQRSSSAPQTQSSNKRPGLRNAANQVIVKNKQQAPRGGMDKDTHQKLAVIQRFQSREKQLKRQKELELARRGKKTLDGREISSETRRVVYLTLVIAVLCLALMTTVSGRWTRSTIALVDNTTGVRTLTEIGIFKSCDCSSFNDASSQCDARVSLARSTQAFSILLVLSETCGIILFFVSSYVSLNRSVEISVVIAYAAALAFSLLSWILLLVLRGSNTCGGFVGSTASARQVILASYSQQGYALFWAFGIRVVECIALLILTILLVMRVLRKVSVWPVVFLLQLVILPLSIVTTSTNEWMRSTSNGGSRFAGPWGMCSCSSTKDACRPLSALYQATQGIGIIQILTHIAQIALVALVPAVASNYKERVQIISAWGTWLIQLLFWSLALATFTDCRCGYFQRLNWPFPVVFLAFGVQTSVAIFATFEFSKKRVLAWAIQQNFMDAAMDNEMKQNQMHQTEKSDLQGQEDGGSGESESGNSNPIQREPFFTPMTSNRNQLAPTAYVPKTQTMSPPRQGGGLETSPEPVQPSHFRAIRAKPLPASTFHPTTANPPPTSRFTLPTHNNPQPTAQGFSAGKFRIPTNR